MKSKNMNYVFNVEYFAGIDHIAKKGSEKYKTTVKTLKSRNDEIKKFKFKSFNRFEKWKELDGYKEFTMYTMYPGLLAGTGNPHSLALENAIKCGFTFDYVTGLPYVTGASLKGVLRAMFPEDKPSNTVLNIAKMEMIKEELKLCNVEQSETYINKLRDNIFDNNDIFIGVIPEIEQDECILELDYITPHKEITQNPVPINIIKIRPNIKLKFCFALNDYKEDGKVIFSADEKAGLFKRLLLISGLGAKTNVGFGALSENPVEKNKYKEICQRREQPNSSRNNQHNNHGENQRSNHVNSNYVNNKCYRGKVTGYNSKKSAAKLEIDGKSSSLHVNDVPNAKFGEIDKILPIGSIVNVQYLGKKKVGENQYDCWKICE